MHILFVILHLRLVLPNLHLYFVILHLRLVLLNEGAHLHLCLVLLNIGAAFTPLFHPHASKEYLNVVPHLPV